MNRFQMVDLRTDEEQSLSDDVALQDWDATVPGAVCHTIFVPLHYEPNYAYPLLVWLHGPDDSEQQLKTVMPRISMRNYVAIAPRGTWAEGDDGSARLSYTWRQTDDDILLSEHRVLECIKLARERLNVAPDRIFLAGYDVGGTMALRIALMQPGFYAGVVSVGGPFPSGNTPLVHLEEARNLPLLIAQGRNSVVYPESRVCYDLRLIHAAGISVTLRQYPCDEEITAQMLSDIDTWIMQQITGNHPSRDESTCYRFDEN